jgi:DeoR family myo-inositol catabolism operon transcriptional repressor
MDNSERQQEILKYLATVHFASISEIAAVIFTSEATVRRDLQKLSEKGVVKLVYGGVVISEYYKEPVPIHLRDNENSAEKELIAKKAADLIEDNGTVIFDSSSTVRRICKHIKERKNLTIITNNLRVCEELKNSNIKVFCTGGSLIQKQECFVGHFAEEFIKKIKADVLFFSTQGLSQNGDITDSSEEEIALRKIMIENSKRQYFLCDSSKIGVDFPFTLCNKTEITDIILKT